MLNKDDLKIIITLFDSSTDPDVEKVKKKVQLLLEQMELQDEFRNRSLKIQEKIKEIQ